MAENEDLKAFAEEDFETPEADVPEQPDENEQEAGLDVIMAQVGEFLKYIGGRFAQDRCLRMAAGLSYTSLLAIVPLTAIAFSMLAAFPVFGDVREVIQEALFANLLPDSATNLREHFNQFVSNTTSLSAVGIIALGGTAVLLLATVEADMNQIFRVARPRAIAPRLLVFWALLTLGPMLLGTSFSLSTYFFATTNWMGLTTDTGVLAFFGTLLPTAMMILLLSVFYIIIPNRPVGLAAGFIGGVTAGIAFTLLRKAFAWYVVTFPTYQNIYGALSVIPIFLVWMYLSWLVVLVGAILTAAVSEWRSAGGKLLSTSLASSLRLVIAVQVLAVLYNASRAGTGAVHRNRVMRTTGGGGEAVDRILNQLRTVNYVERTSGNRWVLARDPATLTVYDLYQVLGLGFGERAIPYGKEPWRERLSSCINELKEVNRDTLSASLAEILGGEDEPRVRAVDARK